MDNKEIQEQRMRGYFIQATKVILKSEGMQNVSVRNIAQQAGYSYATLYNYFKDIKDLIFLCVKDFQDECIEYVTAKTNSNQHGFEKIEAIASAYINYFLQYPGIFELFFIEKATEIVNKQPTVELICSFFDTLCATEWEYCMEVLHTNTDDIETAKNQLRYIIVGLLLFYLNRRYPADYTDFIAHSHRTINSVLVKLKE